MYDSCIGYVFSVVRRYISNTNDHPDVIQEIFARLFLSIDTFDEKKGEFKFWLRRLTINQCMEYHRKHKKSKFFVSMDQISEVEGDDGEGITELAREDIKAIIEQMPEGYKQVFLLVIIDDFSHKEVGKMLDISPETSRSQLSRAKKWLRQHVLKTNPNLLTSGI